MGGGDDLRVFLNMNNIFVRDVPRSVPLSQLQALLHKIGGPASKVVIPLDYGTGKQMGQAYINYNTEEEARRLLDKHRFSVVFEGQMCKVMFAAKKSHKDKDMVYGPYSYKFQVIVKNLSETVDTPALFKFFSKFGEVYQCKTDTDAYGQYYGQVTYLDVSSVDRAVEGANGTRWDSSIVSVEPHHKAHLSATVAPAPAQAPPPSNTQAFPALGSTPSPSPAAAAAASPAAAANGSSGGGSSSRLRLYCPPDGPAGPSSSSSTPVNFAVQALAQGSNAAGVPSPALASSASTPAGAGRHTGLGLLRSPSSAAEEAAASTAMDVARLVLSEGSSGAASLASPAAAAKSANSGNNAAAAIAAAAGLGGGPLLELLNRRRAAATPPGSAVSHHASGLPSPALAHGLLQPTPTASPAASSARRAKGGNGSGLLRSLVHTLEQVSDMLCCPITHEVFSDPVVAADGITYERAAILNWLRGHDTSPMTNDQLPNRELHPNNLVRALVQELL